MKKVKPIIDFYIFSNLHVSLAVFCLTKLTLLKFEQEDHLLPIIVFLATLISYNLIRFIRLAHVQGYMLTFIQQNKPTLVGLLIVSSLVLGYLLMKLSVITLVWLVPFGICTLLYVYPVGKNQIGRFSLRSIGFFKIFLIAFSWAGVTVLLPAVHEGIAFDAKLWAVFLQRFLFIIVITLPFDIRDLAVDLNHIKTVPQVYGVKKTRKFGLACMMLFLALDFVQPSPEMFRIDLAIALLSLGFLFKASSEQNKYYAAFWIEGIPIVWFLITWVRLA